ncbi:hypothetical protein AKO1_014675 [Acrasis kona]|uniref:Uncharacterized protein n=1 Tax=Acrasis kona TaxID=1008807 RepID=A0AAW2Z221_9EUKA
MYLVNSVIHRKNEFTDQTDLSKESVISALQGQIDSSPNVDLVNEYLDDIILNEDERRNLFKNPETRITKIIQNKDPNNPPIFDIPFLQFDEVSTRAAFTLSKGSFVPKAPIIAPQNIYSLPGAGAVTSTDKDGSLEDDGSRKKKKKKKKKDREGREKEGEDGERKKKKVRTFVYFKKKRHREGEGKEEKEERRKKKKKRRKTEEEEAPEDPSIIKLL